MGKLISILGASGVGKTTFARALAARGAFTLILEEHETRPFQKRFAEDARFAFHNQVDYLLFRAAQEREARKNSLVAVADGGLEMDFYGFTRLFHARGMLDDEEFSLCERLYKTLRLVSPLPDIFLKLTARTEEIQRRLARRERINIARAEDAAALDSFLNEFLDSLPHSRVLTLDVSEDDPSYTRTVEVLLPHLQERGLG